MVGLFVCLSFSKRDLSLHYCESFNYIHDMIWFLLLLAFNAKEIKGGVHNISTPASVTIYNWVNRFTRAIFTSIWELVKMSFCEVIARSYTMVSKDRRFKVWGIYHTVMF